MRKRLVLVIRVMIWTAAAGMLSIGLVNLAVWWPSRSAIVPVDQAKPAQAALVLGAYVYPNGTPSAVVRDRLETALELYRAGKVAKVLVTGDHGDRDYDEVNGMRLYLEKRGVPTEDVFMDHAGFDTYDSMIRARDVFEVKSAVVVTQAFHLPRALYIARKLGLEAQGVEADRAPYVGAEWYRLREIPARVKAFGEVLLAREPMFRGPAIPITGDGRATHG